MPNAFSQSFPIRRLIHSLVPQDPLSSDFLAELSYFLKLTLMFALALELLFDPLGIPIKNVIDPLSAVAAFPIAVGMITTTGECLASHGE
jgi:hypothetical protein